MYAFKSFRARLVTLFGGLLLVSLSAVFLAVGRASVGNARRVIVADLAEDAAVFRRLFSERTNHLLEAARLLSGDYAFKEAYWTQDEMTILSLMENHLARIGDADLMLLVSLDGEVIADTEKPGGGGRQDNPWPELLAAAEQDEWGEAAAVVLHGGRPLQLMVVPLLTPDLEAWILIGFLLDDPYAEDLSGLLLSEVSILRRDPAGRIATLASTRPAAGRAAVAETLGGGLPEPGVPRTLSLGGERWVAAAVPLSEGSAEGEVAVLLQRSLAEELAPYAPLRTTLAVLFFASLAVSAVGAVAVARSVTRPVLTLAERARRIEKGEYEQRIELSRRDEIGELAGSFNEMARGLAEKERVRALLGKVVSPAIAEELLSKEIELGGEERVVTVLFSDVRNFTTLCEGRSPREILELLNLYLTRVSAIVEEHGGVVDKYIGDAVMALFGAPLADPDDAGRAVATGLGMRDVLRELNAEFEKRGLPRLGIGVGVNTDMVVAGNMGSETRLNYTVIGDGVNLASRLEGLTKRYGLEVIVSGSTRDAAPGFVFRELDRVRVKGKAEAVRIYEPVGREGEVGEDAMAELARFETARRLLLGRQFQAARDAFATGEELAGGPKLWRLYRERAEGFLARPPGEGWDGTVEFSQK
ncbi:MAG: adenylate/guanylate cyclase domain-containing protein [Thermoanaerobaculia bacterium]|nr:adenylate/guanylate cyclase domain-containing protein [Thermoanaerobaculia bacterium]